MAKWDRNKPEFKQQALERMKEAKNIGLLAQELGISVRTLYRWKDRQLGREKKLEGEIQQLKQSLANRTLEVDFVKGALQKVEARR